MKLLQSHKLFLCRIFVLVGIFLSGNLLHANDEETIRVGVARLNALIDQNAYNDAHWQSYKNHYVFSLEPSVTVVGKVLFVQSGTVENLDKELTALAAKGIHLYVGVNVERLKVGELKKDEGTYSQGKITAELQNELYSELDGILTSIYEKSKAKEIGLGKNSVLAITPVKYLLAGTKPEQDRLIWIYYRMARLGEAYPNLVYIINHKYKTDADQITTYARSADVALLGHVRLYMEVMTKYESLSKELHLSKTITANQFRDKYKQIYSQSSSLAQAIDGIADLIDEDEGSYLEYVAWFESLMRDEREVSGKYMFLTQEFTVTRSLSGTLDEFQAFAAAIKTFREHKKNVIQNLSEIGCGPRANETEDAFRRRVYYFTSLLSEDGSKDLPLNVRKNVLCALSGMRLSGYNTVFYDRATTSNGKEEVVNTILLGTKSTEDRRALLDYIGKEPAPGDGENTILTKLMRRINGDNYSDFVLIVSSWIADAYPENAAIANVKDRRKSDVNGFLPLNGNFLDSYKMDYSGKAGVSTLSLQIFPSGAEEQYAKNIPFNQFILVHFVDSYSLGGVNFKTDEYYNVPAMLAYGIMHKIKYDQLKTGFRWGLYGAAVAVTVTELVTATTVFAGTVAFLDVSVTVADFVFREVMIDSLGESTMGPEFLTTWNKYTLYYALGQAATHLSGLMESMEGIALASKELRQARAMELLASANRVKLASIDDALRVGDNAVAIVGGGLDKAADYLKNTVRQAGTVDVLIHGSGSNFKIMVRTDEGIIETITDHRGLAKWLYKKGLHKHRIRLLSCSNAESAQDLARKLGQDVFYTPDVVRLHADGGISTLNDADWYMYSGSNRTQTVAERPRPPSRKNADDFVQMGETSKAAVGSIAVSSGLAAKLGGEVSNLNNWLRAYGSQLKEPDKILSELEGLIGNKQVLEVLEDGQKRLSVVLRTDGITYDLIAIQKNVDGDDMLATYNRAYNKSVNTAIDVGVSENRLVPDYRIKMDNKTPSDEYLYPQHLLAPGKSPVVEIKMTGKRRGKGGDFEAANKAAGLPGTKAPTGYVWHHMDDFNPKTGTCKMQLVLSDAHTGVDGMAHSGSVAQWKSYYGKASKAPGGLFYEK